MRTYQFVLIAVTAIAVAAIAAYVLYGGGQSGSRGVAQIGGPFTLVDQNGEKRSSSDFRGKYMLIYFGYTYCPDVCPTALQVMTRAMDELAPETAEKITPIFITVDPERDKIEQVRSYVGHFHPRMVGLTGSPEQIGDAARKYRVYFGKTEGTGSEGKDDYLVDHSSIVFLMDPEGNYVTHFTHTTAPDKMAAALRDNVGS